MTETPYDLSANPDVLAAWNTGRRTQFITSATAVLEKQRPDHSHAVIVRAVKATAADIGKDGSKPVVKLPPPAGDALRSEGDAKPAEKKATPTWSVFRRE